MSYSGAIGRGLQATGRKLASGNIFATVGLGFEILGAFSDLEIEKLSAEYQAKWDAYKKAHKLDMQEINYETRRLKSLFVRRLLYDELSFSEAKKILGEQVKKQQEIFNKTAKKPNLITALKEITLIDKVDNKSLVIGLFLIASVIFIIYQISDNGKAI